MAGASIATAANGPTVQVSVENPTWGIDRSLLISYSGSETDESRLWIARDKGAGACPATPTELAGPEVRWLLGKPGAAGQRADLEIDERPFSVVRTERGPVRVCAWTRSPGWDPATGDDIDIWHVAQRTVTLRRVTPTAAERRQGVRQIRAEMHRSSRVWHRMGARTRTVGPRFSRIDPTFALVGVTGATRRDQMRVQSGHTIYHLRNGRWHRLSPIMGDVLGMWCDEGDTNGRVPLRVLKGYFGPRVCSW